MNLFQNFTSIQFAVLVIILSTACIFFQGKTLEHKPLIIWWTPLTTEHSKLVKCSLGSCIVSEDRELLSSKETAALIFYGSSWSIEDLPPKRYHNIIWALLHEESPKNQPIFNHKEALSLFNISSTFKQSSDMPLTLQYLHSLESLTHPKEYFRNSKKGNSSQKEDFAPIMYMQSDCDPPSERDIFVKELSKHIKIDSYGKCLNNKKLPDHLVGIETMSDHEILQLISNYKFTLSLENYACEDYITEKLWRPLTAGSVPIYWGAPNVDEWLPNKPSVINVREYASPKELALYLNQLLDNNSLYEAYLKHKTHQTISNEKLKINLRKRSWGVEDDELSQGTFVEHFECFVCDAIIQSFPETNEQRVLDVTHYGCPPPERVMNPEPKSDFWMEQWKLGKAEGMTLLNMLKSHTKNFDYTTYIEELTLYLKESGHFQK